MDPNIVLERRGTTALHLAATTGADVVVHMLLAAAHWRSVADLGALVAGSDRYGRTPADVAFTDKGVCLLHAAAEGTPPAQAVCPGTATRWGGRWSTDAAAPNTLAAAAAAAGVAGSAGARLVDDAPAAAGIGVDVGVRASAAVADAGGWRAYGGVENPPPLALDLPSARHCEVAEVEGNITAGEFLERYQSLRRPVVFRGAARHFPAFTRWTRAYLKKQAGKIKVAQNRIPYVASVVPLGCICGCGTCWPFGAGSVAVPLVVCMYVWACVRGCVCVLLRRPLGAGTGGVVGVVVVVVVVVVVRGDRRVTRLCAARPQGTRTWRERRC